jgi:hypothetical protein
MCVPDVMWIWEKLGSWLRQNIIGSKVDLIGSIVSCVIFCSPGGVRLLTDHAMIRIRPYHAYIPPPLAGYAPSVMPAEVAYFARIFSAARRPSAIAGAFVLSETGLGITEQSATRNPSIPRTRNLLSTTDRRSLPTRQVAIAWNPLVKNRLTDFNMSSWSCPVSGPVKMRAFRLYQIEPHGRSASSYRAPNAVSFLCSRFSSLRSSVVHRQ